MKGGRLTPWTVAGLFWLGLLLLASAEIAVYTNHFWVELHRGGEPEAKQLAAEYGFSGVRKVRAALCLIASTVKAVAWCIVLVTAAAAR